MISSSIKSINNIVKYLNDEYNTKKNIYKLYIMSDIYYSKYLKYKNKYFHLRNLQSAGASGTNPLAVMSRY